MTDEKIAEITIDPRTNRLLRVDFSNKHITFACRRCAVFCCKLGGPKLSSEDIENLKKAGNDAETFLGVNGSLKSRPDGSCIFLSPSRRKQLNECLVYHSRPALCRLYPFHFGKLRSGSYAMKIIPCCNGLNSKNGQKVNEQFFAQFLERVLLDLIAADFLEPQF